MSSVPPDCKKYDIRYLHDSRAPPNVKYLMSVSYTHLTLPTKRIV